VEEEREMMELDVLFVGGGVACLSGALHLSSLLKEHNKRVEQEGKGTKEKATIDDILSLELKNILNRRLQTILVNKKLARSMRQARQFITHQHVTIADEKITVPGHLVTIAEEAKIGFYPGSGLHSIDHPERYVECGVSEQNMMGVSAGLALSGKIPFATCSMRDG